MKYLSLGLILLDQLLFLQVRTESTADSCKSYVSSCWRHFEFFFFCLQKSERDQRIYTNVVYKWGKCHKSEKCWGREHENEDEKEEE